MKKSGERITFIDRLAEQARIKRSVLCLGLDPFFEMMPPYLKRKIGDSGKSFETMGELFERCMAPVIDAAAPHAIAAQANLASYLIYGETGVRAYRRILAHAEKRGLATIGDAKCAEGDYMAETARDGYLGAVPFWDTPDREPRDRHESSIRSDAVTVTMAMGSSGMAPFAVAAREWGAGVFVLARPSFKTNSEFDLLRVGTHGEFLWEWIGHQARKFVKGTEGRCGWWNVGVTCGATFPNEMRKLREILPHSWIHVVGFGKQGGTAENAVAAVDGEGRGCLVVSSRAITYAWHRGRFKRRSEEFAEAAGDAARAARDDLNRATERVLEKRKKAQ